ncbi:MAG: hypothetical protein FWD36_08910 [Treponema sp.]|nr:hypothetical protein [Treponema sp.]
MERGIVIVGNESALLNAIEIEAAKRAGQYAVAPIANRLLGDSVKLGLRARGENTLSAGPSANGRIPLDWNPGSPISARTLIIAAENHLDHISDAILVCAPPSIRCAAADLNLTDIEVLMHDHIKGWFFLVKELAIMFKARGKGTLALVYSETSGTGGKDDNVDFLGPAALAAFKSLVRSLLDIALIEPYLTLGFSGIDIGDEAGFAAFVFKQLDDGSRRGNGKLYKYGKLAFFR